MHNSESVVDDSAKADISNHLHSVVTQEDLSRLDSLKHSLKYCPTVISFVNFYHLATVYRNLQSLDVSKACGPDLILIEKDISSGKVIGCPHV